tara:strand:+ start:2673 stop:2867 length:195 start_codon:yes stop_codon:yes gene_type:complete
MKILIGDEFMCIKKVVMNISEEIVYAKGYVYKCEEKGCITDMQKRKNHKWIKGDKVKKYFLKIK